MISDFKGKTAVLTGAGSGFGLECARIAAQRGMNRLPPQRCTKPRHLRTVASSTLASAVLGFTPKNA